MGSKTKIVVLHLKELVYTAIFAVLGILLILLLVFMFLPDKKEKNGTAAEETMRYTAGVYTSSIQLNDNAIDVEVVVDSSHINSISLKNLMQPALDNLSQQIYKKQSLENISYGDDNQYTSTVLMQAIQAALDKAAYQASEMQ